MKDPGTEDETAASTANSSERDRDENEASMFPRSSSVGELAALRLRCQALVGVDRLDTVEIKPPSRWAPREMS